MRHPSMKAASEHNRKGEPMCPACWERIPHGTKAGYVNWACRCDTCRSAAGHKGVGAPWKHRLISQDASTLTGVCLNCGPVTLGRLGNGGLRCSIGRREQRGQGGGGRRKHGLTDLEARDLRAAIGACQICGSVEWLAVDHDHETQTLRGVLCYQCNVALGFMGDDPDRMRRAAAYIEKPPLAG